MNERYMTLRAYMDHYRSEQEYELKLEEVDAIWYCSRKNTKRILKQLETEQLLTYKPGRGRGNSSKISYFTSFQEEMEAYIAECTKERRLESLAEILRLPIPKSWVANSSEEIRSLLGLHRDVEESKDVLHTFKARDIESLDPLRVSLSLETHILSYLGDSLIRYDLEKDCFIPHIAHHFQVDETEKIWTFYLRKSVYFHHHDYVTSKDVAYTIERMKAGPPTHSWLARNIVKVECPHPHKVVIHLDEPNPFFLRYLSAPIFCILPSNVEFDEYKWLGTGPFKMKERTDNKLVLQANEFYFKERPLIDEIHFYRVRKEAAKTIYLSGEESPTDIEPSKHKIYDAGVHLVSFNLKRDTIVQNYHFRKAIYQMINVEKLAKDLEIDVKEASSLNMELSQPHKKESENIQLLLKNAGYKGETLNVYCFGHFYGLREGNWLKDEARKFGISLSVCPISYHDFVNEPLENEVDILLMGLSLSFDKHLAFSYALQNPVLLFNRLFSKEIEEYIQHEIRLFELEADKEKRTKLMLQIERHLQQELAFFYLYHPIVTRYLDPSIQDVESPSFGQIDYSRLWIPN